MVKGGAKPPDHSAKADLAHLLKPTDFGMPGRLSDVIRDYPTRAAAAEAAGVVPDQLSKYIRGAANPAFETVAKLAAGRGFSLDWVWSGTGQRKSASPTEDDAHAEMILVPIMDVRAGAGDEQYVVDEAPISSLALPRKFLLQYGIRPGSARLMFCVGDSMVPTIQDRAPMVVDTSDPGERDGIYVMRRGNGITVKRLQHLTDGSLLLKSDNPAYEPDKLPKDEADELRVIGRVGLALQSI